MYDWGHGAMWIVWLLILIGVIAFFGAAFRGPWWGGRSDGEGGRPPSAREILDQRFARGELTKEQYEDMKRTLER